MCVLGGGGGGPISGGGVQDWYFYCISHYCFIKLVFTDKQKRVAGVVPAIEKAHLYLGKGGEIMRAAVFRFIECVSISSVSVPEKIKRSLLDSLNENLRHPNSQMQVVTS